MPKTYRSGPLAAVHETASGLAEIGLIDKRTMKKFDALCLTPVEPLSAEQIRAIRLREDASQAVFARYLNVTTGLVSQWERGEKRPRGGLVEAVDPGGEEGAAGGGVKRGAARPEEAGIVHCPECLGFDEGSGSGYPSTAGFRIGAPHLKATRSSHRGWTVSQVHWNRI